MKHSWSILTTKPGRNVHHKNWTSHEPVPLYELKFMRYTYEPEWILTFPTVSKQFCSNSINRNKLTSFGHYDFSLCFPLISPSQLESSFSPYINNTKVPRAFSRSYHCVLTGWYCPHVFLELGTKFIHLTGDWSSFWLCLACSGWVWYKVCNNQLKDRVHSRYLWSRGTELTA